MSELLTSYQEVIKTISSGTKLICVSKTRPFESIRSLYEIGQRDFGENKVQELLDKSKQLSNSSEIRWHFIGSLQSNKINQLLRVGNLVSIHSVDSLGLLEKLLKKKIEDKLGLFLQVNTSGESEKSGFTSEEDLVTAIELIEKQSKFYFQGFMTIGRIRTDDFVGDAKKSFQALKVLKGKFPKAELSMGMSSDYQIAQEYSSDWVRIGSSIFGSRD